MYMNKGKIPAGLRYEKIKECVQSWGIETSKMRVWSAIELPKWLFQEDRREELIAVGV